LNFGAAPTARTIINLNAAAFEGSTSDLKANYSSQITALPKGITAKRPAIMLNYTLADGEDASAAQDRLMILAKQIEAMMKSAHPDQTISIETNVARATNAAGRE
jgi:hypothetical protein